MPLDTDSDDDIRVVRSCLVYLINCDAAKVVMRNQAQYNGLLAIFMKKRLPSTAINNNNFRRQAAFDLNLSLVKRCK